MKFCNRCGDPVSGPRCKCGGTPKEAQGSGGGEGVSTMKRDVWSRKYLTKGLEPATGRARSASSGSESSAPKCTECGLRLSPTVDGGLACRVCILKPSSKGVCAACDKPVIPLSITGQAATWVEYGTKIWHKECFRCRICHIRLTDPMVDLTGQPCCEDCLMAQAGARTPMDEVTLETATATATTTSNIHNGNGSNRQPMNTPPYDSPPKVKPVVTADKAISNGSPVKVNNNNSTKAVTTTATTTTTNNNNAKATAELADKKKASSKPKTSTDPVTSSGFECNACQLPITNSGVRLPSGRLYHPHCFTCAGCGKEFKDSAFVNYGGRAYHPDCTPKSNVERCGECGKYISGFYVKNNGISYHSECFKCTGCKTPIGPKTPFGEIAEKPYCELCLKSRITGDLYIPPPPSAPPATITSSTESPSNIDTTTATATATMINTTRRGSEDKSERTNNTSFGVHDASLIQLDPSMERDIGVEQQWHSTTKVAAATSPVLAPTAVKAQQNKPSSPSMVVASTQNLPSPDSPRITPVTSNAAIGRAMGRAQMSPSPSSPPKNGRIAVASTAAELAFNEGVMGGARAAAHARSRSAASPLLRPTATQSPPLSAVSAISGATSNGNNNGVSSGTSTPYASRPVSPRLRFEESLLSPNASSEIALSRSSSRSSNTSNWDSRLPPPINVASNPVGRSVGTPITTTFAPYNHQNNGSNGSVGGGHQPTRFAQLGGTSRCFKCNQRLYAIDEVPGPRATKWHRNCLACLVCRKPLDSMALMRDDTDGPYCRMCYIKKGRRVTALM